MLSMNKLNENLYEHKFIVNFIYFLIAFEVRSYNIKLQDY